MLDLPVRYRKGIGPKRSALLESIGLRTVRDLLLHLPREYQDRGGVRPCARLRAGEWATVRGTLTRVTANEGFGRRPGRTVARLRDASGEITLVWFRQPWKAERLHKGDDLAFSGKVSVYDGDLALANPEEAPGEDAASLCGCIPVYPATEGLPERMVRGWIRDALPTLRAVPEWIPTAVLRRHPLKTLPEALRAVHRPATLAEAAHGRERLVFGESLLFHLARLRRHAAYRRDTARPVPVGAAVDRRIRARLGVAPTRAQERAFADLRRDLARSTPMRRLLMGDVGSGKTAVALYGILAAVAAGGQTALMAPTEILAEQHFLSFRGRLEGSRVRIALCTGAQGKRSNTKAAEADLVVGTHALLSDEVRFRRLDLAVIDEQHRFGVAQRQALRAKGSVPHLLVMTATPIPRTLALAVFGDLETTILDEMPPGRTPIATEWVRPDKREDVLRRLGVELSLGRQAYLVTSRREEEGGAEGEGAVRAAVQTAERCAKHPDLGRFRIGLIHGRMSPKDKEETMARFRDGRIDLLVGTTVVEVGLDVPNATWMVVEDADRLGLAQLHQLRGRVGRGPHPSRCVLIAEGASDEARERLHAIVSTSDGFRIAEKDLLARGPGALLGTRQAGLPELRVTNLARDAATFTAASREAARILAPDPGLSQAAHGGVRRALAGFLQRRTDQRPAVK
ncbi:MAG: ATP-dependent DNA helicase RecG [Planctomycetes bacterium]|nr:ATP-dependent DNA helicase RecG [Planctomycetota bacterium]